MILKLFKIFQMLALACCFPTLGLAAVQDFIFENDSGFIIHSLYVSPHGEGNWLNDVLGEGVLENDHSTVIQWTKDQDYRYYDIRVVYSTAEGRQTNFDFTAGYDLLKISKIWITWDGKLLWLHYSR